MARRLSGSQRRKKQSLRRKNITPVAPTAKDKDDARKESELAKYLKNKPKGGYKDTSPKPKPKPKPKTKDKLTVKPYVDVDAADKKAEKVFRSSSSGKVAKEKHAKNEAVAKAKKEKSAKEAAAKKEAKDREEWEKKTRNSPARRSGAFSDEELWEKQKKHRQWKADRKSGKLKKERKKKERLRIASPMDMD